MLDGEWQVSRGETQRFGAEVEAVVFGGAAAAQKARPHVSKLTGRASLRSAFLAGAVDELVEIALFAGSGRFLHQQGKTVLVETLEPLVPRDLLQRILARVAREIQADHPDVTFTSGILHARRFRVASFGPLLDLVVVRERHSGVRT